MSGIKRDKWDRVFSDLIRERADWTCQRCGVRHEPPTRALHCAHLFTRRARSTRTHPDAAIAACYGCHQYLDSHPEDKERLARQVLGDTGYDRVRALFHKVRKRKPDEKAEMYAHYRSELASMRAARDAGRRGWLEFVSWD